MGFDGKTEKKEEKTEKNQQWADKKRKD